MLPFATGDTGSGSPALDSSEANKNPIVRPRKTSLGLLTYCFALAQKAHALHPVLPNYNDPLVFIARAAELGANAIQFPFGIVESELRRKIRTLAQQLNVALESTVNLPQSDQDLPRFEAELLTLTDLGISVARTVVFRGRRYEDLHSYSDYRAAEADARLRLHLIEPSIRRHKIRLAVENHKDQRADDRVALLQEFSSEYIGACIDVGNNIALLEDPVELTRALLPWALTTHFKDQGIREYEDGFLLADVPLGQGCIDLVSVVRTIRESKPHIHLQLELITRDALPVPVLRDDYWKTFPTAKARDLGRMWALLKAKSAPQPFTIVSDLSDTDKVALERRNIEDSFRFAVDHLGLSA